jgi:ribosomal protein S18 acetylase RimI-like enzyme
VSLFSVRKASPADLMAVADVWHRGAASMNLEDWPVPSHENLLQRARESFSGPWSLWVAVHEEAVVGMLALKRSEQVLDQLFIVPEAQGMGVGPALLDVARQQMPRGFTLHTPSTNHRGARFYERQGLEMLGLGQHPVNGLPIKLFGWTPSS